MTFILKKMPIYLFLATSGLRCGEQDLSLWCVGLDALRHVGSKFPD